MVQYIFTPWRERRELLQVRRQFYSRNHTAQQQLAEPQSVDVWSTEEEEEKRSAVARVFMWMHRGNCPHVVESTALLMSAILEDRSNSTRSHPASSSSANYAILAAYMSAFTRFVPSSSQVFHLSILTVTPSHQVCDWSLGQSPRQTAEVEHVRRGQANRPTSIVRRA